MWCEEQGEIMEIATTFFKNLFQSQGVTDTKEILDAVVPSVSDEMNVVLTLSYHG